MDKDKFTDEDVINGAATEYAGRICLDLLEEAMQRATLKEAVDVIVLDSMYWNGELC